MRVGGLGRAFQTEGVKHSRGSFKREYGSSGGQRRDLVDVDNRQNGERKTVMMLYKVGLLSLDLIQEARGTLFKWGSDMIRFME